jgi:hypothetical protein
MPSHLSSGWSHIGQVGLPLSLTISIIRYITPHLNYISFCRRTEFVLHLSWETSRVTTSFLPRTWLGTARSATGVNRSKQPFSRCYKRASFQLLLGNQYIDASHAEMCGLQMQSLQPCTPIWCDLSFRFCTHNLSPSYLKPSVVWVHIQKQLITQRVWGPAVAYLVKGLRYSRKVVGSIPDGGHWIFLNLRNPSSRTRPWCLLSP